MTVIPEGPRRIYTVHTNAETDYPKSAELQKYEDNKSEHSSNEQNLLVEKQTDASVSPCEV